MDFRTQSSARFQLHKRVATDSKGSPTSARRVPVLVRSPESSDNLVCSQLLLPVQQCGSHHEGVLEDGQVVLHFPVGAIEPEIGAL